MHWIDGDVQRRLSGSISRKRTLELVALSRKRTLELVALLLKMCMLCVHWIDGKDPQKGLSLRVHFWQQRSMVSGSFAENNRCEVALWQ